MTDERSSRQAEQASWSAEWTGLKVLVLGLDPVAFSVVDTLAELGADVLAVAEDAPDDLAQLVPVVGARLEHTSLDEVPTVVRNFAPEIVVATDAVAPSHPILEWARRNGADVWGDVELAWRVRDKITRADGSPAEWLVVAGSAGKTTTTALAATMLLAGGLRAAPCGSGGVPILDAVRDPSGFDALVVELSEGQLRHVRAARGGGAPVPLASACLGAGDGADLDALSIVYRHTVTACVYNRTDPATMRMVEDADVTEGARAIGVGLDTPGPSDLGVVDGILADRAFVENRRTSAAELSTIEHLDSRGLAAPHHVFDVLVAAALARAVGIETGSVAAGISNFVL